MIKKIHLVSNCLAYGPTPSPKDEIEQHITLLSDGRVWLSRYCYGSWYKLEKKESEAFRIHTITAAQILQAIEACFEHYQPVLVSNTGTWSLSITYKSGNTKEINGSLCRDDYIEGQHLSKRIRAALNREKLFLFDGKTGKSPDELIFCNVRFDHSPKTYCYLADTDDYEEGDQAVVIAGEEKREVVVTIVSVQYLPAEKAPYPLDRIKHIIRKQESVKNPVTVLQELEKIASAPFETKNRSSVKEWRRAYDALVKLTAMRPDEGKYLNMLGFLCYYGLHTDDVPQFEEARKWYEMGAKLNVISCLLNLADMLIDGLGGGKDTDRGMAYYNDLYWYFRKQLEDEKVSGRFAEVAYRIGKRFHEGFGGRNDDMAALNFLLEARFAISKQKLYKQFDDDDLEQNIEKTIKACKTPPEELRKQQLIGMGLGSVPRYFLRNDYSMSFRLSISDDDFLRIHFDRRNSSGSAAARGCAVIWAVPPTMECFSTSHITLYGKDVRMVWNQNPGQEVLCDRYEYDEKRKLHQFFMKEVLTCKLMGGDYYLYMPALRPAKHKNPKTKLDPYKQQLYDAAKKYQDEHGGPIFDCTCPLCGQGSMYVSIENNRLFASCRSCFKMIDIPWPDEDEVELFDFQRMWKDL